MLQAMMITENFLTKIKETNCVSNRLLAKAQRKDKENTSQILPRGTFFLREIKKKKISTPRTAPMTEIPGK